jgi:catechol 2,3-dioxygenase-like lactoylglutathione lyase family enzyme
MPDFALPPRNESSPLADVRGRHVGIRTPSLQVAKDFYVDKLDFRIAIEWDYTDEKLAYLLPPNDDNFYIEILAEGDTPPTDVREYSDLGDSLKYGGLHHFCMDVASVDATLAILRDRGVPIVAEPFVLPVIGRKLAFVTDPFGNLIELAEKVED